MALRDAKETRICNFFVEEKLKYLVSRKASQPYPIIAQDIITDSLFSKDQRPYIFNLLHSSHTYNTYTYSYIMSKL